MTLKSILSAPVLIFTLMLATLNTASAAEEATATAVVNMRSGDGTSYAIVTVIPAGARVVIYGCDDNFRWCDTSWRGHRGWVHGAYLSSASGLFYRQGSSSSGPASASDFNAYWEDRYRSRNSYYGWHDRSGLWNPLEAYRDEYGSSYYYQHR